MQLYSVFWSTTLLRTRPLRPFSLVACFGKKLSLKRKRQKIFWAKTFANLLFLSVDWFSWVHDQHACLYVCYLTLFSFAYFLRIASTEKLDVFAKTDLKFEEKGCLFNAKTYFVIRYLLFFTISLICAIHPAKIRSTDFWYSLNYNGRSYLTFQVAKWGHQDIAFWTHSLRTFKLSVQANWNLQKRLK